MSELIAISLNPNAPAKDSTLSLGSLFSSKNKITEFENAFLTQYPRDYYTKTFYTGRAAWYAILHALGVGKGDEILVPAFTCVAVINPIVWLEATPVFVDITNEYVMDLVDAERKVTSRTKVVLAQHTFGHVVDYKKYFDFAKRHQVHIVEDCAHALGSKYEDGTCVGTKGIASFFSFGRDKCISGGSGGLVLSNDEELIQNVRKLHQSFAKPTILQVVQDTIYPLLIESIYILFAFSPMVGKLYHQMLLKVGIIKKANSRREKKGMRDNNVLCTWSAPAAAVALKQLKKLDAFIQKRKVYSQLYGDLLANKAACSVPQLIEGEALLRFAVQVENPERIHHVLKEQNVFLGDWYSQVIGPDSVIVEKFGYKTGTCPNAERICRHVINLPTSPRLDEEQVKKIADLCVQALA